MYAFARSFPMATGSPDFSVVVICYYKVEFLFGKQGWRRVVHSPPTIVAAQGQRHMWVEFVVGSLLCSERVFSGYSGFPLSSKTNTSRTNGHILTSP